MPNAAIDINTRICQACWTCVTTCPQHVLGKVTLPFHRHAKIVHPHYCTGCYQCSKKCAWGAIVKVAMKEPVFVMSKKW